MPVNGRVMKEHFAYVLMDMCETRALADITVKDLLAQAGTARQTFYNHFVDINDLINYTASRPLLTNGLALLDPQNSVRALSASLAHRGFFCQLGRLHGQNSYWPTWVSWCERHFYRIGLAGVTDEGERLLRKLRIDLYLGGAAELLKRWYEGGAVEPVEMVVQALHESTPSFMFDAAAQDAPTDPANYPQ